MYLSNWLLLKLELTYCTGVNSLWTDFEMGCNRACNEHRYPIGNCRTALSRTVCNPFRGTVTVLPKRTSANTLNEVILFANAIGTGVTTPLRALLPVNFWKMVCRAFRRIWARAQKNTAGRNLWGVDGLGASSSIKYLARRLDNSNYRKFQGRNLLVVFWGTTLSHPFQFGAVYVKIMTRIIENHPPLFVNLIWDFYQRSVLKRVKRLRCQYFHRLFVEIWTTGVENWLTKFWRNEISNHFLNTHFTRKGWRLTNKPVLQNQQLLYCTYSTAICP